MIDPEANSIAHHWMISSSVPWLFDGLISFRLVIIWWIFFGSQETSHPGRTLVKIFDHYHSGSMLFDSKILSVFKCFHTWRPLTRTTSISNFSFENQAPMFTGWASGCVNSIVTNRPEMVSIGSLQANLHRWAHSMCRTKVLWFSFVNKTCRRPIRLNLPWTRSFQNEKLINRNLPISQWFNFEWEPLYGKLLV